MPVEFKPFSLVQRTIHPFPATQEAHSPPRLCLPVGGDSSHVVMHRWQHRRWLLLWSLCNGGVTIMKRGIPGRYEQMVAFYEGFNFHTQILIKLNSTQEWQVWTWDSPFHGWRFWRWNHWPKFKVCWKIMENHHVPLVALDASLLLIHH